MASKTATDGSNKAASKDEKSLTEQAQAALNQAESVMDHIEDQVEYYWDYLCDLLEDDDMPDAINWLSKNILRRLTVEAPVIILFCFICVTVHLIQQTIWPDLNRFLAIRDTINVNDFMQIPTLFTHIIAHDGSLGHIKGNMVHLLLVGPSAEHVFGSQTMLMVIGLVAVTSAVAHILLGQANSHQLGASGVVFAVILLNSLVAAASGTIPLSFILTTVIWCWDEVVHFIWKTDNVSHHAHLSGAFVAIAVVYYLRGGKSTLEGKIETKQADATVSTTATAGSVTVTSSRSGTSATTKMTPMKAWFRSKMQAMKTKTQ